MNILVGAILGWSIGIGFLKLLQARTWFELLSGTILSLGNILVIYLYVTTQLGFPP